MPRHNSGAVIARIIEPAQCIMGLTWRGGRGGKLGSAINPTVEADAMKGRPINVHQKLSYGAEKATKPLLWLALALLAVGLLDALVFDARRVPGEVFAFAGAIWAGFEFWRLHNPGDAMLVLSPAGLRLRIVGVKKVLIPWHDIHAVSSRDLTVTDPTSTFSLQHDVPNATTVEVSKRFYERFLHVDSFLQRGPGWDNIFVQEGDVVRIALHEEVLPVKSDVLREEIEARWKAFRETTEGEPSPRARVMSDGGTADKAGWWVLVAFGVAGIAFVSVQRSGLIEAWKRYEWERRVEESARQSAEWDRESKKRDEDWAKRWAKGQEEWSNPPKAAVPVESVGVARGHSGAITWISPTPDGKNFLTASIDKTVKLWDVADNRHVRNVAVHASIVRFVAVLPDGMYVLTAGDEGNVVLSALADGKIVHVFEAREHGPVRALAVSGDGRRAVSIHNNGTADIWNIAERTRVKMLQAPGTRAIALSADGAMAVTGSDDGSLGLWDIEKGSLLRTFEGSHSQKHGGVYDVAVTPDGTRAVSGGGDDMVRIWDLASGRELRTLSGHTYTVRRIAVSADGKRILSGSADARIWDAESGKEVVKFDRSGGGPVAFADDLILTVDNYDYSIRSWKPNGQLMKFFAGNRAQ